MVCNTWHVMHAHFSQTKPNVHLNELWRTVNFQLKLISGFV